jgi:hypothetical protein
LRESKFFRQRNNFGEEGLDKPLPDSFPLSRRNESVKEADLPTSRFWSFSKSGCPRSDRDDGIAEKIEIVLGTRWSSVRGDSLSAAWPSIRGEGGRIVDLDKHL